MFFTFRLDNPDDIAEIHKILLDDDSDKTDASTFKNTVYDLEE